jgi:hypothetical protein
MTAAELLAWLETGVGKGMNFSGSTGTHTVGMCPPTPPHNQAYQFYFPVTVNRHFRPTFGTELAVQNAPLSGDYHALFIPDRINTCPYVYDPPKPIVISGRFTGCTFARCGGTGMKPIAFGHIYVDSHIPHNNPATQARNFEIACGSLPYSAVGFSTIGQVTLTAMYGYVIAVNVGWWRYYWVSYDPVNSMVVTCRLIGDHEWHAL